MTAWKPSARGLAGWSVVFVGLCLLAPESFWSGGQHALDRPGPERAVRVAVEVGARTADEHDAALAMSLDVWTKRAAPGQPMVVVLTPASIATLASMKIPHRIVIDDIDEVAERERERLRDRVHGATTESWFSEYRDVVEVSEYLDKLAMKHPTRATLRRLGTSIEGWPLRAAEISAGGDINIVLNGGHHAREWISVMVPMCIADRLLSSSETDSRVRSILSRVRFIIAPLVNPDGYAHSWTVDRYWRKNRRGGHGVDLNRNYSVAWGKRGSSGNKRSQTYRGESAFSEPETQAMRRLFMSEDVAAHIDFHSYSQLILYPWNYTREEPADRDKLAAIADRMSSAMVAAHGYPYKIMPGSKLGIGASGTFTDWTYGERKALSFVVELRPARGSSGFVLPPEQIIPTCDESYAAVLELAEWVINERR